MKEVLSKGLGAALIILLPLVLEADFASQHWRFRRWIKVQNSSEISSLVADGSVYKSSLAQLRDLRIINGGAEIPFSLRILSGTREQVEAPATMLDKAVIPGIGLQVVIDLKDHPQHNQIRIATEKRNFKDNVRIETSDDDRNWALAEDSGLIFDVSRSDRHIADLTVDYPLSTRRYVRITIPGWTDPSALESAWIVLFRETDAVRDLLAGGVPSINDDKKDRSSSFDLDLGCAGLPYDRINVYVKDLLFSRAAEVYASSDGKDWSYAGQGLLSRTARDQHLSVTVSENWLRYLRLVVFNEDNAALTIPRVEVKGVRRVITFPSNRKGMYWLYSGSPLARRPSYDFESVMPDISIAAAASLGQLQENAEYRPADRPWTDRNSIFLNFVLACAVLAMGYVTIRFLLKIRAAA